MIEWDEEVFCEEIGLWPIFHPMKRAQEIIGAGVIGIPVSLRDLGALCGYHGNLIG